MRACFEQIELLVNQAGAIPGDFAEFGVWKGDTFIPLARAAAALGKSAHAVDSFEGMDSPGPLDFEPAGSCMYPKGALNPGPDAILHIAGELKAIWPKVLIWRGWIPDVFERMDLAEIRLAFSHVDLDQYAPTLCALAWAWARTMPGGIVCCHDWFPEYRRLASAAIREWMEGLEIQATGVMPASHHIWFHKGESLMPAA